MISFLKGHLAEKSADGIVVDVGGVGYAVAVTAVTMHDLPQVGEPVRVLTHYHAGQDQAPQLFGFMAPEEKAMFSLLIGVQGVGPKLAMTILGSFDVGGLSAAISQGETGRLVKAKGVGRKVAERLIVELKDKVGLLVPASAGKVIETSGGKGPGPGGFTGRLAEVFAGLSALGYRPTEFQDMLSDMRDEGVDATESTPALIKRALVQLAKP